MNLKYTISNFNNYLNVNDNVIWTFIISLFILIIVMLIKKIILKLLYFIKENKTKYRVKNKINIFFTIINIILFIILWYPYFKNILTLISVFTAAIAIALREILFNIFCGIFIKVKKPFNVEDRIEIDDIRGDVVNINLMNFEVLEVDETKDYSGQSTGIIINVPNSKIFAKPLKNFNKAFKYIWDEITLKISIKSDLDSTKKEIYKILNSNDVIRDIPKKMKNKIENLDSNYRIYYNNYNPIIYTKVEDNYIELTVRFLIHPKKTRFVESDIWEKVLIANKNRLIDLYFEHGDDIHE